MAAARIYEVTDISTVGAGIYQQPSSETQRYLAQQMNDYVGRVSQVDPNFGQQLLRDYTQYQTSCNQLSENYFTNVVSTLWSAPRTRPITLMEEMQLAPTSMQRWILANPAVQDRYLKNEISGYNDTYEGIRHNQIGIHNRDYRIATSGVMMELRNKLVTRTYTEVLEEEDILTVTDKYNIRVTWNAIEDLFNNESNYEDPTSSSGGTL